MSRPQNHNPWVAKTPEPPTIPPAVLCSRDAAHYVGVSERTLYQLAKDDQIVCTRFGIGKKCPPRYLRADLDAFLNSKRQTKPAKSESAEGGVE